MATPEAPGAVRVLQGLNLEFAAGSRTALLGPSGVGKSTLVCLLGLLTGSQRFEGSIRYVASDQRTHEFRGLAQSVAETLRRTEFGFALQSSYLLPHLTLAENLSIPLGLSGLSPQARRERAVALLMAAEPKLGELADSLPSELSGGQQQRVAVLRALIHNPVVVFADEPFSALDEENKSRILETLIAWQEGTLSPVRSPPVAGTAAAQQPKRTLFLVCHDPEVPRKYKADVLKLNRDLTAEFIPHRESPVCPSSLLAMRPDGPTLSAIRPDGPTLPPGPISSQAAG